MDYQRTNNLTPATFVRVMGIIHMAMIVGPTLFAFVVISLVRGGTNNQTPTNDGLFIYLVPALDAFMIIMGNFVFRSTIAQANTKESLNQKLAVYQTATIIRFAMCEGAALFSVVITMLTNNLYYLAVTAAIICYMATIRPTKNRLLNDLNLSFEEQAEMGN